MVSGHVQGVGFRAFVSREAWRLGVRGSVRNRADGSVELVAEHEAQAVLDDLVERLRAGPGRVADVQVSPADPTGAEGFFIERSG